MEIINFLKNKFLKKRDPKTSIHEAGHVVVAYIFPEFYKIEFVTGNSQLSKKIDSNSNGGAYITPVLTEMDSKPAMFFHTYILICLGGLASDLYYENRGYIDYNLIIYNDIEWIKSLKFENESYGRYSGDFENIDNRINKLIQNNQITFNFDIGIDYFEYHRRMLNLCLYIISNEYVWKAVIEISNLIEKGIKVENQEILSVLKNTSLFIKRRGLNKEIKTQITNITSQYNI